MSIKQTKKGRPQKEEILEGECTKCGAVYEAAMPYLTRRNKGYTHVCLTESCLTLVYFFPKKEG